MRLSTKLYRLAGLTRQKFDIYGSYSPVPLNLKSLLYFGQSAPASRSFEFLKYELPVRLANIMHEAGLLPSALLNTVPVQNVIEMYENTFQDLINYENISTQTSIVNTFTEELAEIRERHTSVVEYMAEGIGEVKAKHGLTHDDEKQLQYFLDRFYINRIGIRTLISQHLLLYGTELTEDPSYVGIIDPFCNPIRLAAKAYAQARYLCLQVYNRAPGCDIETIDCLAKDCFGHMSTVDITVDANGHPSKPTSLVVDHPHFADLRITGPMITFCYLPGNLLHILFELLKNAMRAVVEHHPDADCLPRISVLICNADEDVTIKITDAGGGMPRQVFDQALQYSFTTAKHLRDSDASKPLCPLAGRGHGLPLSRLHARYLNGNLKLTTVEGVGSSAIVYLKRRPEDSNELLPIFNRTSKSAYQDRSSTSDWISGRAASR